MNGLIEPRWLPFAAAQRDCCTFLDLRPPLIAWLIGRSGMKTLTLFASCGLLLFGPACARKNDAEIASDSNETRLKALYREQDSVFGDRYGTTEAFVDIGHRAAKLYVHGFPSPHQQEFAVVLKERFQITLVFAAGCEASPRLVNFVDAYNACVLRHIADKFGPSAFEDARKEAEVRANKSP